MAEKAMFAAGCFWGVESNFRKIPGVTDTAVGYSGGHTQNPDYEAICSHGTGHAEVVEVTFDPDLVSFEHLVSVFFTIHDPTQIDRQGPDVGDQYRSAIFCADETQKKTATDLRDKIDKEGRFRDDIATQIKLAETFWRGEEYHQRYFEKHGIRH
jgi:peptide-methionine (S)-S-oxide reductase